MTDTEKNLLVALISMVEQYLWQSGDLIDSSAMSAGQDAIEALASLGLVEIVDSRFGRWTEAGKQFRRDVARIREDEPIEYSGIQLVGKTEAQN